MENKQAVSVLGVAITFTVWEYVGGEMSIIITIYS